MTIKQQGGVFGRNPSFSDVDVKTITVGDSVTTDELTVNTLTTLNNTTNLRNAIFDGFDNNTSSPSTNPSTYAMLLDKASTDNYYSNAIGFSTVGATDVTAGIYGIDTGSFNAQGIAIATGTTSGINEVARFNSHGLSFSQSNSASASLDDYEEGTFQPTHGGFNMSDVGIYRKIGDVVFIHMDVTANASAVTTNVIGGLPFTVNNRNSTFSVGYTNSGLTGGYFAQGTTDMRAIVAGGTADDNLAAGERVILSGFYTT